MLSVHSDLCRAPGDNFPFLRPLAYVDSFVPFTSASSSILSRWGSALLVESSSPYSNLPRRKDEFLACLVSAPVIPELHNCWFRPGSTEQHQPRWLIDRSAASWILFAAKCSSLTWTVLHNVLRKLYPIQLEYIIIISDRLIVHIIFYCSQQKWNIPRSFDMHRDALTIDQVDTRIYCI